MESVYHQCLNYELKLRNINFISELPISVKYKEIELATNFRCDLLIENCLVIELKALETTLPIHEAQLLTYMKLIKAPKGILMNFNVLNLFREGQRTFVNEYFTKLREY